MVKDTELNSFKAAVQNNDLPAVEKALESEAVRNEINNGIFDYGRLALLEATSPEMVDLLLEGGANIETVTQFWANGFWLENIPVAVSQHLIGKGAEPTIHTAAALGLADIVSGLLSKDTSLVSAPGGDGATALHFARTVEAANVLLDYDANLDAWDDDHRSTPAQWRIKFSPQVAKLLLGRGAAPDLFLAAALGDLALANRVIEMDPKSVTYRIGNNSGPFPGIGFEGRGGTMLQWQLGFNLAPQEIAWKRGHHDAYELMMATTPAKHQLLIACMLANRDLANSLLSAHPGLIDDFDDEDRQLLAKACWETNNETEAIRLMLDCAFPVGIPEYNHGYLPLHNAAWCGNSEVVRLLISHGHPIDELDPVHHASAAKWAIISATQARCYPDVNYGGVIKALMEAGMQDLTQLYPTGHPDIDVILEEATDKPEQGVDQDNEGE